MEKDLPKDKYTLVFPKVSAANIGTITAKASNEFGTIEKNCELDVLDAPKLLNKLDNLNKELDKVEGLDEKKLTKPEKEEKAKKEAEVNENTADQTSIL
jgi:hypothetical protein